MPEDLQTTLFQMLQRLEKASTGSRSDMDVVHPKGERRRNSQPDEMDVISPAFPFSEAPINMLNMTWAEKGKGKITREEEERLAKKPTERINKLPEYPKAAIIKGMVMCSKCQCECELEIPSARVLIDHELVRRKEEDARREAREKNKQATRKDTSRSVFQRLGGDSQPKALSEVFRNHEASDEAEKMEATIQRGAGHPQNGQMGREDKRTDRIANPGRKGNPAHLGRKWYVVGKNGQPTKPMGSSMIRRVQRQHKAYMNYLKTPTTSEASKNQKLERATSGGNGQLRWRNKKEVEKANNKAEGVGDHVPQVQHPGKYRILRRAQEDLIMIPTPGWKPEPIHMGTVARPLSLPLLDPFGEVPKQTLYEGMDQPQREGAPEPLLPADAMAWLDEFMEQIGSNKEDLPEPSNFHINMAYVLSATFGARPDQPATMEGDYLTTEPMMAQVNVEIAEEEEEDSGKAEPSEASKGGPMRIYTDEMMFSRPSISLANHLKPIYVSAHLEGVPFKRILIDGGAAVNVLPAKQMRKMGRGTEDLIPTDLTVSSFSGAITRTYGILPLEVDLGSKKIMLAFFVVDCTSTYGALLGRDWIHQSLAIPSTLHQQVAVYHEVGIEGPGFWEIIEAETRPFLPSANVAEASFYNPNVGILKCSGADKNGRPTMVTA
ncbi:hypothetical protein ACFX16_038256 [Malus domestica]